MTPSAAFYKTFKYSGIGLGLAIAILADCSDTPYQRHILPLIIVLCALLVLALSVSSAMAAVPKARIAQAKARTDHYPRATAFWNRSK